jgi:hypothetical protein
MKEEYTDELQYDENGRLVIPASIKEDQDDEKWRKKKGLSREKMEHLRAVTKTMVKNGTWKIKDGEKVPEFLKENEDDN